MFYVPKSHKKGLIPHDVIGTNVRIRTGKKGFSLYNNFYKNSDHVSVPMAAGQILGHDKNTIHFSSPNLTDEYRIAVTVIVKLNDVIQLLHSYIINSIKTKNLVQITHIILIAEPKPPLYNEE